MHNLCSISAKVIEKQVSRFYGPPSISHFFSTMMHKLTEYNHHESNFNIIYKHEHSRECKPPKFPQKMMGDSNLDFQINPDPDLCWICPKMLWMHYLIGNSHFAKYGTNWPLIV